MNAVTLRGLPVRHLEYIFVPAGLPLVAKAEGIPPTTSILVRGGAGAGKTTLAMALGQGIARAVGGSLLYLTTEFSQAELLYKAQLLGFGEGAVLPWRDRGAVKPGGVVTEHLALRAQGQGPLTSAARKASSIEVVWELSHSGTESPPATPVRAVVIDAFTLPGTEGEDPEFRSDLVAFVQALEKEGISTLLIEESTPGSTSWLPFVVDLVFEIEWAADPDIGALDRKLRCTKSRYARALAGPHGYGLEAGVPAVWPDLLAIAAIADREPGLRVASPAAWFVPLGETYARFTRGGIVLVPEHGATFLKTLPRTPGVSSVEVRCGTITTISGAMLSADVQLFDIGDIQDLGWTLLGIIREHGVNTIYLHSVEPWLRRPHLEVDLLHLLDALRALGALVLVQAKAEGMHALASLADLSTETLRPRRPVAWPLHGLRSAALFMLDAASWAPEDRTDPQIQEHGRRESVRGILDQTRTWTTTGRYKKEIAHNLHRVEVAFRQQPSAERTRVEWALLSCQVGTPDISPLSPQGPAALRARDAFLWLTALTGREYLACAAFMNSIETPYDTPSATLLWSTLCALHAQSAPALEVLHGVAGQPEGVLCFAWRLRALVAQGCAADVEAEVLRFVAVHPHTSPLVLGRLRAEAMLFSTDEALRREATDHLAALWNDAKAPWLHRADAAHNLGVFSEHCGERDAAIRWYLNALDINPRLEAARQAAQRLGVAPRPAPE